jgi:inorganic triphosphatase YgiF
MFARGKPALSKSPSMSDEIELKLEVAPDAAQRLIVDEQCLKTSLCRSQRQLSVYYDTPDFLLRKSGYSLRVRAVGDRFVQTLKSLSAGAGMFARGEWESELGAPEPDLSRLVDSPIAELEIEHVEPVIRSEIDRTICRVDEADSELELDVDLGTLSAASREMRVSELELELISGEPRAAMELAQRIASETPVKLGVMSKAERGFALADGRLSDPTKAEPVALRRGMNIAEGFETIVLSCLRHFRLNEPIVIETRKVEALHQARVAIRRLRSALSLFRRVVSDYEFERIDDELRWLTAELGDARNLDVYLELNLAAEQRLFVERRRDKAYDLVIAAMDSARCRQLMLDLLAWATTGQWRKSRRAAKPLELFMRRRIDRMWTKVSRSGHVARMGNRQRHHLRIKMKKLRYALQFAGALQTRKPRRKEKFAKAAKEVQQSLGKLHDIVTARSLSTLNSWLTMEHPSTKAKQRLVRKANVGIKRLRGAGPYWRAKTFS